jgi:hypothetical protein
MRKADLDNAMNVGGVCIGNHLCIFLVRTAFKEVKMSVCVYQVD